MKDVAEKDIKTFLYTQYIQGFKGKHKHRRNKRYKKISDFNIKIKTAKWSTERKDLRESKQQS